MRIVRLEIIGFKSFRERLVLNFEGNLIGIVGPNGCGKSNIVDALRWVLGETQAKQLRGKGFEDLIFNGSEAKRATGMAEVSITLRPEEDWSPNGFYSSSVSAQEEADDLELEFQSAEHSDKPEDSELEPEPETDENTTVDRLSQIPGLFEASEIQLTRRLYRSGESQYFINRLPCRLKDMSEFYRLVGLGARGLSIVQQGQIGALISKKPLERRELIEEAAGISGFRARIEAASRQLDKTKSNTSRLFDLIAEVEKRVRSLRRQANRAKRRNELKEQLKNDEQELFVLRIGSNSLALAAGEGEKAEREAEVARLEEKLSALKALEQNEQSGVTLLDQDLNTLRSKRDTASQKLRAVREKENEMQIEFAKSEERISSLNREMEDSEERGAALRNLVTEKSQSLAQMRTELKAQLSEKERAEEELARILLGKSSQSSETQSAPAETGATEEIEALSADVERYSAAAEQVLELEKKAAEIKAERKTSENALSRLRVELAALKGEIGSLSNQLQAIEESHSIASPELKDSVRGTLAAGMLVPEALQKAVAAVLGEKAHYLLSEKALELANSEEEKSNKAESTNLLGVVSSDLAAPSAPEPLDAEDLRLAPSARFLLEELEIKPQFAGSIRALLATTVFVESAAEAVALRQKLIKSSKPSSHLIVTKEGQVFASWGWYRSDKKGLAFAAARRLEEKQGSLGKLEGKIAEQERVCASFDSKLADLNGELADKLKEREQLFQSQQRLTALLRESEKLEREKRTRALEFEREAQKELRRFEGAVNNLSSRLEFETSLLAAKEKEIGDLEEKCRNISEKLEQEKQRKTAREEELGRSGREAEKDSSKELEAGFQSCSWRSNS